MKLKSQLTAIIVLLVFVLSAILISAFILTSKLNSINNNWHKTNQVIMAKNSALFRISRHFGYGGFIHHFKNLVLRQTQMYSQQANESIEQTQKAIALYQSLVTDDVEQTVIDQFEQTVLAYRDKLTLIQNSLSQEPKEIHDLDERVKLDDSQAIAALEVLSMQIAENNQRSITMFNKEYRGLDKFNRFQLLIIIPMLLVTGCILAFYTIRITRAYSELETIFNLSPDALLVLDLDGNIIRANPKAREIFGYSKSEFSGITVENLVPDTFRDVHAQTRFNFQTANLNRLSNSPHAEVSAIHKDGKAFPVEISLATYGDADSQKTIANVKDLSHYKTLEQRSTTDHLTGVANRLKIDELLLGEFSRSERLENPLAFILMDIDHFKSVNDSFGHQVGDQVLQQFATIVNNRIRRIDVCGRWGGEEFCIICPGTTGAEAYKLAEDLRQHISNAKFGPLEQLTCSFGVASYHDDDSDVNEFVQRTDIALYQSKQFGRNQVTLAS